MTRFTVTVPDTDAGRFQAWLNEQGYAFAAAAESAKPAPPRFAPKVSMPTMPDELVDWDEVRERWARHKIGGC